jgi:hypothetical protein
VFQIQVVVSSGSQGGDAVQRRKLGFKPAAADKKTTSQEWLVVF